MNHNVILLKQFALVYLLTNFLRWYYKQLELSLLILVYIRKSCIIYFEISVVPIGHGFSFFGHRKVMKNQCWKRGGTLEVTVIRRAAVVGCDQLTLIVVKSTLFD